jgi:hypothetical protein
VVQAVDPVFLLSWDGSEVTLRVAQGYVGVRSASGTVPLGSNQQASYSPGDRPGAGPWDQSDVDGELRDTLRAQVGQAQQTAVALRYAQFGPDTSPALAAAVDRGVFRVAVTSDDRQVQGAATAFIQGFLGHGPTVKLDVSPTSDEEARAALDAGDVEMVVGDRRLNPSSRPLFTVDGTTWFVAQGDNGGGLVDALGAFVTVALEARCSRTSEAPAAIPGQSCYEQTYRRGVGGNELAFVPLDALGGYLGLS